MTEKNTIIPDCPSLTNAMEVAWIKSLAARKSIKKGDNSHRTITQSAKCPGYKFKTISQDKIVDTIYPCPLLAYCDVEAPFRKRHWVTKPANMADTPLACMTPELKDVNERKKRSKRLTKLLISTGVFLTLALGGKWYLDKKDELLPLCKANISVNAPKHEVTISTPDKFNCAVPQQTTITFFGRTRLDDEDLSGDNLQTFNYPIGTEFIEVCRIPVEFNPNRYQCEDTYVK